MLKSTFRSVAALALSASVLAAQPSQAPAGTFSASLPSGVTFGGSGIPGPVMMTSFGTSSMLVLGASQRFDNAPLTNDGAGRYFALAGNDISSSAEAGFGRWNFNFYIGGGDSQRYNYRLYIDHNPLTGNTNHLVYSFLGIPCVVSLPAVGVDCGPPPSLQGSLNLGMGLDLNGRPTGAFDPDDVGEYTFSLVAYRKTGFLGAGYGDEVARAAIAVNTTTVPEPSTYALMAAGLLGLVVAQRRRRRA